MDSLHKRLSGMSSKRLALLALDLQERLQHNEDASREPIAIVGMACSFPQAPDINTYWSLLSEGRDAVTEMPADRWDTDRFYSPDPNAPGKMYTRHAGFIDGPRLFDATFFGISAREARSMDPQQRLLLETAWRALEDALVPAASLVGTRTGVFMGISTTDYLQHGTRNIALPDVDAYMGTGCAASVASGRLSYILGLNGPSIPVDTACSSSLVAVHLACQSLRRGESDLALVGGVNLMLLPDTFIYFSRLRALSPDGRCKTFDAAADGYGRGEGCGVVVLKRWSDALAAGDEVVALIRGSAVNHDGRSNGLTVPSGLAQEAVVRSALHTAQLRPDEVCYVEAHGTGTPLGDPIELHALGNVHKGRRQPLWVGSAKTNIGHLEAAAGIAGLIKVALMLRERELAPHLHLRQPNPYIDWSHLPIEVVCERQPFTATLDRLVAGVSSFGFGGTNAHVVLEAAPMAAREPPALNADRPTHVLCLSAKSDCALKSLARGVADGLERAGDSFANVCWSANVGRTHFEHRLALQAGSADEARGALLNWVSGQPTPDLAVQRVEPRAEGGVAFLFSGQGSQYVGMGRVLFDTEPSFRNTLLECEAALSGKLVAPLTEILWGAAADQINRTDHTQPALFSLEVALGRLWLAWGIKPRLALGHSVGEYAAAHLAGVFSLDDGLRLIAARGRLMHERCQSGAMLALSCGEIQAARLIEGCAGAVSIAALNGPNSTVISGDIFAIEKIQQQLAGLQSRRLSVSHAFHSVLMEPMLEPFAEVVRSVRMNPPEWTLISNLTGKPIDASTITSTDYWVRHVREPVQFEASIRAALDMGIDTFIEVGPKPVLLGMAQDVAQAPGIRWLASLQPPAPDWSRLAESLRRLHLAGVPVNWAAFDAPFCRRKAPLPSYPFERQSYWIEGSVGAPPAIPAALTPTTSEAGSDLPAGIDRWLYGIDWVARPTPAVQQPVRPGVWLLLADSAGLGEALAGSLRAPGREVVLVRPGPFFAETSRSSFELRPLERADYTSLFDQLGNGLAGIVHLWSLDTTADEDLLAVQRTGYRSALALLQALLSRGLRTLPQVCMVTRGAQGVVLGQPVPKFAHASLWGLARVANMEFPNLRCLMADLDPEPDIGELAWLADNVLADDAELLVAQRAGRALAARLARRTDLVSQPARRPEGAWLISGGLGGIGLQLAGWLVDAGVSRIALISRSAPSDNARAQLTRWMAHGAQVVVVPGDVADPQHCKAAVDRARAAIGPLSGVLHAAGTMDNALLVDLDWSRCGSVLAPKVLGAWHLHQETLTDPLRHFICFSSVSSILGVPGHANYAPANAVLDAFAAHRRGMGLPGLSINWGPWAGTGMAARLTGDADARLRWTVGIYGTLQPDEALEGLARAMTADDAQLAILSTDWDRFFQTIPLGLEPPFLAAMGAEAKRVRPPSEIWIDVVDRAARVSGELRREIIGDWLERELAAVLGSSDGAVYDGSTGFFERGMDSLMSVEFRTRLQVAVGSTMALPVTLAFDHPNINALATYFEQHALSSSTVPKTAAPGLPTAEPVAIVGIGCRFPGGADDALTFWRHLCEGRDAIAEVPKARWNVDDFYDADPDAPGKMNTRFGGFIDDVESFDAAFFGVSPREAMRLDPQQRLLLETSWRALEDTGLPVTQLRDTATGVFVGVSINDYTQLMARAGGANQIDAYMGVGNALSMVAGRVAHFFGLQGPAMSVDTACSSSLVAVHLACNSLREGECAFALAGGVNTILLPEVNVGLSKARMLAPDGRCKTFDAAADGYGRSEGCGVLALKRLSDAQRDGNRIIAVIRASAMNHDGRSSGLTVPNAEAQARLLKTCLDQASLQATDIDYVEAHGTGTPLGDPIEVQSLDRVLGRGRPAERPLLIGASKTNVGHLESAAGAVGLIKTALALQHGEIPATLHQHKPNPYIPWRELAVKVVAERTPWPQVGRPRRAGVSSFGFSGTNAHVILEQAPEEPTSAAPTAEPEPEPSCHLLTLSAKTRMALGQLAERMSEQLIDVSPRERTLLADICHSANAGRTPLPYRLAVVGRNSQELAQPLATAAAAAVDARTQRQCIVFLFTGQGSQYAGMGRALFEAQPRFRSNIERCEELLAGQLQYPLTELLWGTRTEYLCQTENTQPALFALEYALGSLWLEWGVVPRFAIGHSVGEYAAACLAGVFSLEDAVMLIAARGRLMGELCEPGAMAALDCGAERAHSLIARWAQRLSLAALNGPTNTVVSGEPQALDQLVAHAATLGVKARRLEVSRAFHSQMMEPMLEAFEAIARKVIFHPPRWTLVSNLTGQVAEAADICTPDYWVRHVREPVQFEASMVTVAALGANTFVEVGPQPVLLAMGQQSGDVAGGQWLPSLRPQTEDVARMFETLGALFLGGAEVNWRAFDSPWPRRRVPVPVYPFERQRFWPDTDAAVTPASAPAPHLPATAPGHVLLGRQVQSPAIRGVVHEANFSAFAPSFLDDHRIYTMVVVPGASHLSMVCSALDQLKPGAPIWLSGIAFEEVLVIPNDESRSVQLIVNPSEGGRFAFEVYSRSGESEAWLLHAAGTAEHGDKPRSASAPDIRALRARLSEELSSATMFYQMMSRQGIQLGPQFRWIDRVWRVGGEALGMMRTGTDADGFDGYFVHPGLLDSCFQLMGATLDSKDLEAGAFIPISIEELHFFVRPQGPLFNHVRLRPQDPGRPEMRVADLKIFDEAGRVVAEVRGLRIHRAPRSALQKFAQRRLRDSIYGIHWVEQVAQPPGPLLSSRRWLVFADGPEFGTRLAQRFSASGALVTQVRAGDHFDTSMAGHCLIDPAQPAHYDQLCNEMSLGAGLPTDIVFGWTLGQVGTDAAAIDAALCHGGFALMYLVQALGRLREARPPRLAVLTRLAQPVDDALPVDLSHAAVWGLGRVIANEFPDLSCLRIDLGRVEDGDVELSQIEHELLAPPMEDQVAFRGGRRFVQRLTRSLTGARAVDSGFAANEPYQLIRSEHGVLDELALRVVSRQPPSVGEVEILVEATGLNFRDVLNALGVYPGDAGPMGGECAGTIVAVGPEVCGLRVGDRVMAIGAGTFSRYTLTDARMVLPIATDMTVTDAATVPVAFVTAWLGLVEMARLGKGESVLIHAGAGGVGMAAVQLARYLGAEIHATAGSEHKRSLLRSAGVAHVYDSRSLDFAAGVMATTHGHGVDVVLNSLAGEFISRSVEVTARNGRFIEIGKNQVWTPTEMQTVRPDIVYERMALDEIILNRPESIGIMMKEVGELIARGHLAPLPKELFPIARAADAFRYLAQARHVGKVVVTHGEESMAPNEHALGGRAGEYIVTGGLGAIGLALARWLAEQGVTSVRLVGRQPPTEAAERALAAMQSGDTRIIVTQADVTRRSEVADLLREVRAGGGRIAGVFHAAGALDDAPLMLQDEARFRRALDAKLLGALHFDELTRDDALDCFVLFSSATAVLGTPGQSNYAAANAFLDALAHRRRREGRPALSVNWGPWGEAGMAADSGEQVQRMWTAMGISLMPNATGLATLDLLLRSQVTQAIVLNVDWAKLASWFPAGTAPRILADLVADRVSAAGPSPEWLAVVARLEVATPDERKNLLIGHFMAQAARVLGLKSTDELDPRTPLNELGLDSLMAVELANQLSASTGVKLRVTQLFDYPTVEALATFYLREVLALDLTLGKEAGRPGREDDATTLIASIEEISDEEVDRRLAAIKEAE